MTESDPLNHVKNYFETTLKNHGGTAKGVDWNSDQAREARFEQLVKIITRPQDFTVLDYGGGYGALIGYLLKCNLHYTAYYDYDIVAAMIEQGRALYPNSTREIFTTDLSQVPVVDFAIACGVFNMKLNSSYGEWTHFVLDSLDEINAHSRSGFSVNFLTKYSDADRMRPDLYYADPGFLFDYCKTHYSKNVALLHDYNLYDFTLLVRKG